MSRQRTAKTTTATTPPITAWSTALLAPSPARESEGEASSGDVRALQFQWARLIRGGTRGTQERSTLPGDLRQGLTAGSSTGWPVLLIVSLEVQARISSRLSPTRSFPSSQSSIILPFDLLSTSPPLLLDISEVGETAVTEASRDHTRCFNSGVSVNSCCQETQRPQRDDVAGGTGVCVCLGVPGTQPPWRNPASSMKN